MTNTRISSVGGRFTSTVHTRPLKERSAGRTRTTAKIACLPQMSFTNSVNNLLFENRDAIPLNHTDRRLPPCPVILSIGAAPKRQPVTNPKRLAGLLGEPAATPARVKADVTLSMRHARLTLAAQDKAAARLKKHYPDPICATLGSSTAMTRP